MSDDTALISEKDGDLLTLTLNRPENANALSAGLVEALIGALETAGETRLCVIRGEGRHFCAGFDLSDLPDISDGDLLWRFLRIEHLLQQVHYAPFPVMCFAHGQTVGAGADLFAAGFHRIAAGNTKFRFPGWNFELALGTRRLTRLIGTDAARDLLIDTKVVQAEEAVSLGLATELYDPSDWDYLTSQMLKRANALTPGAIKDMLALTSIDTRKEDIAAIVSTAGRPGLKDRINTYRDQVAGRKSAS